MLANVPNKELQDFQVKTELVNKNLDTWTPLETEDTTMRGSV